MIKLIKICTCSLSSQYGRGSAYLCCENKEIDQGSIYVVCFFYKYNKIILVNSSMVFKSKQCMVGTLREHTDNYIYIYIYIYIYNVWRQRGVNTYAVELPLFA